MTTSPTRTPYEQALLVAENLRAGDRAFFATQNQHACHQMLLETFVESGMRKSEVARRSGHSPAVITRLLSEPSNYETNTVAVVMAAMGYQVSYGKKKITSDKRQSNYAPRVQRLIEAGERNQDGHNALVRSDIAGESTSAPSVTRMDLWPIKDTTLIETK